MAEASEESPAELARQLKQATLTYERYSKQIVDLMERYEGHSENMPQSAHSKYRELAAKRDEAYARMQALEWQLFKDA